jgi:hypothetical protein
VTCAVAENGAIKRHSLPEFSEELCRLARALRKIGRVRSFQKIGKSLDRLAVLPGNLVKSHRPRAERARNDVCGVDGQHIMMARVATNTLVQLIHDVFFALDGLHKQAVMVQQHSRNAVICINLARHIQDVPHVLVRHLARSRADVNQCDLCHEVCSDDGTQHDDNVLETVY